VNTRIEVDTEPNSPREIVPGAIKPDTIIRTGFIERWLPSYVQDARNYLTVAIGCTGGQHRSPYVVEQLASRFAARERVLVRHRVLDRS